MKFLKEISIRNYYEPDIAYPGVIVSPLQGYKKVGKAFRSPDFIIYKGFCVLRGKTMVAKSENSLRV